MGEFVNVDAYLDEIKEYMPHYVFYRRGYSAPELVGFGDYCAIAIMHAAASVSCIGAEPGILR